MFVYIYITVDVVYIYITVDVVYIYITVDVVYIYITVDVGTLCRPIQCSISCEEGFLSDLHGCKICECAEQSQSLDTVGVADHDQSQIGRAFVGNAEASVLEEVETILQKLIKYFF